MSDTNGHRITQSMRILREFADRCQIPADVRQQIENSWDIPPVLLREIGRYVASELCRNGSAWWEWLAQKVAAEVVRQEEVAREDRAAMGVLDWLKDMGFSLYVFQNDLYPNPKPDKKQRAKMERTIRLHKLALLRVTPMFTVRNAQGPAQRLIAELNVLAQELSEGDLLEKLEDVVKVLRERVKP